MIKNMHANDKLCVRSLVSQIKGRSKMSEMSSDRDAVWGSYFGNELRSRLKGDLIS